MCGCTKVCCLYVWLRWSKVDLHIPSTVLLHDVPFGRMAAKMFTFLTSSNVLAIPRPNIAGLKSTLVSVEWMQTVEHLHKPEESKQQEVSECTTAARVLPLPYTRDKSNDFLVQVVQHATYTTIYEDLYQTQLLTKHLNPTTGGSILWLISRAC